MRKLVFFDVDGTLVSYSADPGFIPEPTKEAVRLLRECGHIVSLATGRSLITARRVMEELGIDHAVLCGGAHIVADNATIFTQYLDQDLASAVARRACDLNCAVFACAERHIYTWNESHDTLRFIEEQSGRKDAAQPLHRMRDVCLINIYGDALPEAELLGDAEATVERHSIEMRPSGITKAHGIRMLARHFGIPMEDTVAFGDSSNDVEMLREAGIGVAVGNGTESAKAAADVVCEPVDDGGILLALQRLGLIEERPWNTPV